MGEKAREMNSISTLFFSKSIHFLSNSLSKLSSLCSNPLFSSIITLYTLILLYIPTLLIKILFSPVFISTGILFLSLLRLGAIERKEKEKEKEVLSTQTQELVFLDQEKEKDHKWVCLETNLKEKEKEFLSTQTQELVFLDHDHSIEEEQDQDHKWVSLETNLEPEAKTGLDFGSGLSPFYLEWNLRGPLEIIYEDYEGEEKEEGEGNDGVLGVDIENYPSLSMYYPESDTDSSSDGDFPVIGNWDSPERMFFKWEEEEREEMIEIALDGKRSSEIFQGEEDNLIEIDISPTRKR